MTEEQLHGNKLIAEFMGYKYIGEPTPNSHSNGWWKDGKVTSVKLPGKPFLCRNHNQLAYGFSWDWLIPVCKKCAEISNTQERPTINHVNRLDWLETEIQTELTNDYDILKVWQRVIDFINLYNQQK